MKSQYYAETVSQYHAPMGKSVGSNINLKNKKSDEMEEKMENIVSHVVFTLKNSRYYYQRIERINPKGYVAASFPYLNDNEEDNIIAELCNVAVELNLELIAFNFCGDHVHCIVCSKSEYLSKMMLLWKGKTAYNYNRRNILSSNDPSGKSKSDYSEAFWAKSFYRKVITNEAELCNAINYIVNNRKKHGIKPLSTKSLQLIQNSTKPFKKM
jgi:REP element-mobilizing transposase RayT